MNDDPDFIYDSHFDLVIDSSNLKNQFSSSHPISVEHLVRSLTKVLPYKYSRVKELLAQSLDYKSYNALYESIKSKSKYGGLTFYLPKLELNLTKTINRKFNHDFLLTSSDRAELFKTITDCKLDLSRCIFPIYPEVPMSKILSMIDEELQSGWHRYYIDDRVKPLQELVAYDELFSTGYLSLYQAAMSLNKIQDAKAIIKHLLSNDGILPISDMPFFFNPENLEEFLWLRSEVKDPYTHNLMDAALFVQCYHLDNFAHVISEVLQKGFMTGNIVDGIDFRDTGYSLILNRRQKKLNEHKERQIKKNIGDKEYAKRLYGAKRKLNLSVARRNNNSWHKIEYLIQNHSDFLSSMMPCDNMVEQIYKIIMNADCISNTDAIEMLRSSGVELSDDWHQVPKTSTPSWILRSKSEVYLREALNKGYNLPDLNGMWHDLDYLIEPENLHFLLKVFEAHKNPLALLSQVLEQFPRGMNLYKRRQCVNGTELVSLLLKASMGKNYYASKYSIAMLYILRERRLSQHYFGEDLQLSKFESIANTASERKLAEAIFSNDTQLIYASTKK